MQLNFTLDSFQDAGHNSGILMIHTSADGTFLGSWDAQEEYVWSKVHKWIGHINVFSDVASTQPQLVYAAFTKSSQHE